jgi:phage gpG-like protein
VTGKLAQSITHRVYEDYAEVGTNISYGAFHEFGFQGTVMVSAFTRRRGKSGYPWPVSAHTRRINYAGRPFLRPALDDVFQSGRAVVIIEGQLREELKKREGAA